MKLTLLPIAGLPEMPETTAVVSGDVLTVDGIAYDLTAVPQEGMAFPEGVHPFVGSITRTDQINATILWHYGPGAAQIQPYNPTTYTVVVSDGPVPSPIVVEEA